MKKFFECVLIAIAILSMIGGQAWATQDTLRPVEDVSFYWNHSGCGEGERYDCVDDPPGFPDGALTYCSAKINLGKETFRFDPIFVSNIDSVVLFITSRRIGDREVGFRPGWQYFIEGFWTFIDEDTILSTSEWQTYSTNLNTRDPDWTSEKINARRFGVSTTNDIGDDLPDQQITQMFLIVYYKMKEEKSIR